MLTLYIGILSILLAIVSLTSSSTM